jgi:hypothetical protein
VNPDMMFIAYRVCRPGLAPVNPMCLFKFKVGGRHKAFARCSGVGSNLESASEYMSQWCFFLCVEK